MKKSSAEKALAFLFFLLFTSLYSYAQGKPGTYKIIEKGSVQNIKPYEDALNAANMDVHRLRSKRAVIVFETGVKAELYSAEELKAMGYDISPENFPIEKDPKAQVPVFAIAPNNYILQLHTHTGKQ
jgi:hypothetical protein